MTASHHNDMKVDDAFINAMAMRESGEERAPVKEVVDLADDFTYGTDKAPKFEHNKCAKYMMGEYSLATMRDNNDLYIYSEGVYKRHGATFVKERIDHIMDSTLSTVRGKSEVIEHIRSRTYVDRDIFDSDEDIINLNNGLYRVSTKEFTPHTSGYKSLRKTGVDYDPEAECPEIDKYIREVVAPEYVQTVYEMCGYALFGRKNLKRAFILEGAKNSGKSVLIAIMESLVGGEAITNVSPLTTSKTLFGAAEYYGKQLNLVDDLGDEPIENTGVLKSIISRGKINAQFKHGQPFDYIPNILCVFATNRVPTTKECDEAFASRFSIIPFPNIFEGETADPMLSERLVEKGEMSGFFNKCILAIGEVYKRGKFTKDSTLADRIKAYQYSSQPVQRFLDERCTFNDVEAYIMKDTLYQRYREWSQTMNVVCDGMGKLTTAMADRGCVIRQVTNDDNDRKRAYIGVDFKHCVSDFA